MRSVVSLKEKAGEDYIEFMIHSSELMERGSPNFLTKEAIDNLYRDMDGLFEFASKIYQGTTVKEYVEQRLRGKVLEYSHNDSRIGRRRR